MSPLLEQPESRQQRVRATKRSETEGSVIGQGPKQKHRMRASLASIAIAALSAVLCFQSAVAKNAIAVSVDTTVGACGGLRCPSVRRWCELFCNCVSCVGGSAGSYNVTVDGVPLLFGVPPAFQFDGARLSPADGSLKISGTASSKGVDGFGACVHVPFG